MKPIVVAIIIQAVSSVGCLLSADIQLVLFKGATGLYTWALGFDPRALLQRNTKPYSFAKGIFKMRAETL